MPVRKTTAVISEFRGKSQFRLASAAEGMTEKRVTFIAMVWDLFRDESPLPERAGRPSLAQSFF